MKRIAAGLIAFVGLAAFSSRSSAEEGGWHPTAAVDVLGVGTLGKHAQNAANVLCSGLISNGFASCTGSSSAYGAIGARLGALYHAANDISFGPSVGYLYGGPGMAKVNLTASPTSTFGLANIDTTWRFLAEGGKKFPLSGPWSASFGGGLGLAVVHEGTSCTQSGLLAASNVCAGQSGTVNRGWVTWELTPSLLYNSIEVGLRYVGFARGSNTSWNTFGGMVGYRF